jgi:hypothetical protein
MILNILKLAKFPLYEKIKNGLYCSFRHWSSVTPQSLPYEHKRMEVWFLALCVMFVARSTSAMEN